MPERRPSPTKDGSVASRPTSISGPRRSLTRALADVVISRKGDQSSPQKFKAPAAVRSPPARRNSEDTGDSSTAVESSSSGANARMGGRVRPSLNVKASPLKQSTQLPQVPPSPTSTFGDRAPRSRKIKDGSSSPASSAATKLSRSLAPSPKGDTSPAVAKSHVNSIRSSSPARNDSASLRSNNSPSPTIGRRVRPSSVALGARKIASSGAPKPPGEMRQSGLRQPKPRPQSAIYLSSTCLAPSPGRHPLTEQNLLASEQNAQPPGEPAETREITSAQRQDVSPPRHDSNAERESSLTPLGDKSRRPVGRLPRRHDRDPSARHSSNSLEVLSVPHGIKPHSKENLSAAEGADAGRKRAVPGNGTALPRASETGLIRNRHSMAVGDARLLHIRGAATARAPSESSDRHLVAKRRRSELPRSHAPTGQSHQRPRPPPRLDIPRRHALKKTVADTTPSTPTTSSRSAVYLRADQTFSVPRKHIVSTPLADTTFSEIPEDDDDAAVSTAAFSFHFPSSVSSCHSTQDDADDDEPPPGDKSSRITPALVVTSTPPQSGIPTRTSRQRQRSAIMSTPSRNAAAASRKRLPTLRVNSNLSPDGPRHSFMPLETSFDRSQEQSRDSESNLLAGIPAPFDTPSIMRGSASVASVSEMSERSLILNERESSMLHSPSAATNFSSPRGNHGSMAQPGPTSISRLLFNAPSKRSGATSPTSLSVSNSGLASPQSVAGPDLILQVRAASLEAELAELRAHFEERETVALTQQSRISSLESELSTLYSVTRARDAANSAVHNQLKQQLAGLCFVSARREWEVVRDSAEAEAQVVATARQMLETVLSSLKSSLRL